MSEKTLILIDSKQVNVNELKVIELRSELKKRGISTSGTKLELQEKLKNVFLFFFFTKSKIKFFIVSKSN